MGLLAQIAENKDALVKGLTFFVGGLALVLVGTFIGYGATKVSQISAGLLAVTGVVVMFLGFFVYVVPPLLPAK